ncbi:E3 ubiquitin-protein ligase PPP1R11-like [Daktulosphaira vitifoliae]|uniref:E3 ubiquitin-protein ligase PPP1R11-like n=1 Tax=Daktulosphaira vitifoliae TaxID=58002 RepID=UPI0021A98C67|nr:E3 ubiquitin-protein ligase PPP1R11-like [Daktulosphaira vitifoliae]
MEESSVQLPGSATLVLQSESVDNQPIHLKLRKPKNNHKQVSWDVHTVDNENMNKKKSKCCCIYEKPKKFGDGDDDDDNDDDECDSCMGKKKTHFLHKLEAVNEEQKDTI